MFRLTLGVLPVFRLTLGVFPVLSLTLGVFPVFRLTLGVFPVFPVVPVAVYAALRARFADEQCWVVPVDAYEWVLNAPCLLSLLVRRRFGLLRGRDNDGAILGQTHFAFFFAHAVWKMALTNYHHGRK